jgi:site-specific DNA recombinase
MEKKQELIIIPKVEKEAIYDRQLKVAAYCRVSTEDDDQIDSLKSQKKYFHNMIAKQKNWTLIDVFYDEGISGTSRKKRDGFNNMIALAEQKEIDLILTKEVSRFSRNMIDTLTIAESLRNEGIYIWFIEDDINTENKKDMEELVSIAHQVYLSTEN